MLALVLGGCSSLKAPPSQSFSKELAARGSMLQPLDFRVAIAHLQLAPGARMSKPATPHRDSEDQWSVPLSKTQLRSIESEIREVIGLGLSQRSSLLAIETTPTNPELLTPLCEQAEDQGAQLLMTVKLQEERLHYDGSETLPWAWDITCLLLFTPFHVYVGDETFRYRRSVELGFYDVREPREPLYKMTVSAEAEARLHELQHGYVLLNPLRAFFSDGSRFGPGNWKRVQKLLAPQLARSFQRSLYLRCNTELRRFLESPSVRQRLRAGDPAKTRLYALVIGQNSGACEFADGDARALHELLRKQELTRPAHAKRLTGKLTKSAVLSELRRLRRRIKKVDRLLIFFAGQGFQDAAGQALVLSSGERIPLPELAAALRGVETKRVAFILDCSFGDPARGAKRGGRTASGSLARAKNPKSYLAAITKPLGWQAIVAAPHDGVTGEYKGHGLLTGLLLRRLEQERGEYDLAAARLGIAPAFLRLSRSRLGKKYELKTRFRGRRIRFPMRADLSLYSRRPSPKNEERP